MREELLKSIKARIMESRGPSDAAAVLDPRSLVEAGDLMRLAVAEQDPRMHDPEILMWVGLLHWARYLALPSGQDGPDLRRALGLFRMVRDIAPDRVPPQVRGYLDNAAELLLDQRVNELIANGRVLADKGVALGDLTLVDRAIGLFALAVAELPAGHPLRAGCLHDAGHVWLTRYHSSGLVADGEHALPLFREAVAAADDDSRTHLLAGLANCARMLFDRTGLPEYAEEAIRVGREAVKSAAPDDPRRAGPLGVLAVALRSRFERWGDRADLDEAITLFRTAARVAASHGDDPATHRSNLCTALRIRFKHAGDAEDLREAIAAGRAAARETASDATPDTRAGRLWALGVALSVGYEHFGDEDDLHEATALAEEVVAVTPAGHAEEVRGLNLLAHQLVMRFERSGEVDLIDRAVECHRRASRIMPDGYAGRDTVLTGLTSALVRRYVRVGRVADLDEAVRVGRSAVAASRPGSSNHAACADAFCRALTSRYRHTGEPADLDEAIEVGRHAVRMIPPSHLDRAVPLTTLSRALVHRHGMRNDPADRREAISLAREAFARIGATHVLWPKVARHLADVLASGSESSAGGRDDLAEAERLCHTALARASTVDERVDLLGLLGNIAFATADGRPEGFDRAVDFHRQVLDLLPPDIPGRAAHHMVIGAALHRRFAASGDPADAKAAIAAYREAASDPRDLPAVRARAARHWAVLAMTRGDHRSALDGFTAAIALLPALTGRRLDRVTRQSLIAEWAGAAADAAACALVEGQPKRAVELLDHGRSVLWSDALRSRQDLSTLAEHHPEAAQRLTELRTALDAAETEEAGPADLGAGSAGRRRDERMRLVAEWEEQLARARRLPGFEHLLLPTPFDELARAAAGGPVVVVNTSGLRCDALIVTAEGVDVVPLDLDLDSALRMFNTLLEAMARLPGGGLAEVAAARTVLRSLLAELWRTIARPVLARLGHHDEPGEDVWPRVWWCPVGPLSFLPIHAASGGGQSVLDRVISSYTPTLSVLASARARPVSDTTPSVLAVGLPKTPGHAPLPAVDEELRVVRARLAPWTTPTVLRGAEATRDAVERHLGDHDWVHFACHGHQDVTDPGSGQIRLWDRVLAVRDVDALRLRRAELAFLSACDTAVGGIPLIDESITLATGMSVAGYRHVIATLWPADDGQSPAVADVAYATLVELGGVDAAPVALHRATRELRRRVPRRPDVWACYVHVGP